MQKLLLFSFALWRYIHLFSEQETISCTQQSKFLTKSNSPSHSFNSLLLKDLHHYTFQLVFTMIPRQAAEFSESSSSSFQYIPTSQQPPQPQPQRHHPRGKTSTTPAFEVNLEQFAVPTQPVPSTSSAPSTSTSVPQQSSSCQLRPAVFQFGKSKQQDFRFDSLQRKGQLQLLGVYYEDEEELRGLYWTKDRTKLSEEVRDLQEQLSNQPLDEAIDED